MELRIALRVDVVQVLRISRCMERACASARAAGRVHGRVGLWSLTRGKAGAPPSPLSWLVRHRDGSSPMDGRPVLLRLPTRAGGWPPGRGPRDYDLSPLDVLTVSVALARHESAELGRLWGLLYAALAWGVAQDLADEGAVIDLATIAGRRGFTRLMERRAHEHGAGKVPYPLPAPLYEPPAARAEYDGSAMDWSQPSIGAAECPPDRSTCRGRQDCPLHSLYPAHPVQGGADDA